MIQKIRGKTMSRIFYGLPFAMHDIACSAIPVRGATYFIGAIRRSVHATRLLYGTSDTAFTHVFVSAYFGVDITTFDDKRN